MVCPRGVRFAIRVTLRPSLEGWLALCLGVPKSGARPLQPGAGEMRRARLVMALLVLAAISTGCPWDVYPCFMLQRGDACTLCEHLDYECIDKEQPHFCDACGECLAPGGPGLGCRLPGG